MTVTSDIGVDNDLLSLFPEESSIVDGELVVGGCRVGDLAARYGTPLYVVDEIGLRRQARRLKDGLALRWPNSDVLFASKSFPCLAMYALAASEGLCVDVAGGGELVMALTAGVDPKRIYQHGNAKTEAELAMAADAGIGAVIVDNLDDIDRLERLVPSVQPVLLRIIPGVAPKTHASQVTGQDDSKFGLPLSQAREVIARLATSTKLRLDGLHLHIGSQVLETEPFAEAVEAISVLGEFPVYDIGGGLGVRYTYAEQAPTIDAYLDAITGAAQAHLPAGAKILIEPGRSLVARSGMSLYRVTTLKRTGRTFVAVDGGMADNLEVSLTGQRLEAAMVTKLAQPADIRADLVGRHCESGDRLIEGIDLADPQIGDLVGVPVTGAYAYTMANNYNGALKPAIVFCGNGLSKLVTTRETYDDLLRPHRPALEFTW
jgi:diaminopimelate decarboxylase